MKGELSREIMEEFVGWRAKIYSLKTKKEEMKKANEVKKNVFKKYISHQDYVDLLKFMHTMQTINSTPSNRIKSPLALTIINDT